MGGGLGVELAGLDGERDVLGYLGPADGGLGAVGVDVEGALLAGGVGVADPGGVEEVGGGVALVASGISRPL